jgi:hypothetical protein
MCVTILNGVHLFLTIAGENDRVQGVGHGNQINGMKVIGDSLYTCGIDDSVKQVDIVSNSYTSADTKLGSQPRSMDIKGDTIITASVKEVRSTADCILRLLSTYNQRHCHHFPISTPLVCHRFTAVICVPSITFSPQLHSLNILMFDPHKEIVYVTHFHAINAEFLHLLL